MNCKISIPDIRCSKQISQNGLGINTPIVPLIQKYNTRQELKIPVVNYADNKIEVTVENLAEGYNTDMHAFYFIGKRYTQFPGEETNILQNVKPKAKFDQSKLQKVKEMRKIMVIRVTNTHAIQFSIPQLINVIQSSYNNGDIVRAVD